MATIVKRPSGRWQAKVRRKGHPSVSRTFRTKSAAERWAKLQETGVELSESDTAKGTTIGSILDRYIEEETDPDRDHSATTSRLKILKAFFGERPTSDLTVSTILKFAEMRLETVGSDTLRRDLMQFSGILDFAIVVWEMPNLVNPVGTTLKYMAKKRILAPKVQRTRRLRPGEYRKLVRATRDNPPLRAMIRLAIETAMRRGDIVKLKPADLRPDGLFIANDKTNKTTVIPISRRARRIIESLGENGFGVRGDSITQAFERACARAGIEDLRFHDLRHEGASRLFEKGLRVEEVSVITRHSDWRSLKIYTQPRTETIGAKLG